MRRIIVSIAIFAVAVTPALARSVSLLSVLTPSPGNTSS